MVQLGRVICDIHIFSNNLLGVAKIGTNIAENTAKNFVNKKIDMFNKKDMTVEGSEITLTNNEIMLWK